MPDIDCRDLDSRDIDSRDIGSGDKKDNIVILCNSLGGFYDFRGEVAQALLKRYNVVICAPDDVHIKELADAGCHVRKTPINRRGMNPFQDIKLYRQYRQLLKEYRPKTVLTYTIKPNIYGGEACRKMHIPYITNITGLGTSFERGGAVQKLVTEMYKSTLKDADCVFFQNNYNRDVLEKAGIHWKKDIVLPGSGVNLEKHSVMPYPVKGACEFLFVGRVMKEKGIEEFLYSAEKYHSDQVKFGIVGYCEEEYEERLKKLNDQGIVSFYGFSTDMPKYYEEAGAVVVPSYHEGMSNVLLEASASGRPVIASDISGCREAVDDKVTGILCRPRDNESLADAVKCMIGKTTDERARMGQNARKKMEREFDRNIVIDRYMNEIEKAGGKENGSV